VTVDGNSLSWMLDELRERVPWVRQVVVLSPDGLLISRSTNLAKDDAEHLSAVASGLQSLARGAGRHVGGGTVRQTLVELENSFFVVTAGPTGTCLAVLADAAADLGTLVYEMNLLVRRVGNNLAGPAQPRRAGLSPTGADLGAGRRD
jgi:predicted regulator of Ras-like GTPase activity (Roadblock/LC7/MglB family)